MASEETTGGTKAGSSKLKMMVVVAGLLVLEAALIIGAMMLMGREPAVARASEAELDPALAEQEKIVEVLVLDAKLPNARSGVSYLYGTEIYVQVKQKSAAMVREKVEQFSNEIKAETAAIWRTSEPQHFEEPKLETLTRKMTAMLSQRFGLDPDDGEPIVTKCVIVMGTGFRVDR